MRFKLYHHYSLYGFSNAYLLGNDESGEALLVDPGEFTVAMLNHVEKNGYALTGILLSHAHVHHVRGILALRKIYEAELYAASARVLGQPCRVVRGGEAFRAAGFEILPYSLPGHSPDSIAYRVEQLLFTGDALHAGLIGKTLSPFNAVRLAQGIRDSLLSLPEDTLVLPGHGPPSTIGSERLCNLGLEKDWAGKVKPSYDFFV